MQQELKRQALDREYNQQTTSMLLQKEKDDKMVNFDLKNHLASSFMIKYANNPLRGIWKG